MSVHRSDDLERDLAAWEREQQEWENSLPRCERCGEFIDDFVWEIDGEFLCDDCAKEKYRRSVG